MSTARQRAANKQNAQKSTGPVTPEGKAISSRNRVSAGFNTTTVCFLDHEKKEDFWQLLEDFTTQYQPANPTEQVLVERMVHNQWNTLRALRLQNEKLFCRIGALDPIPHDLGLLIRYQTAAERGFDKARNELIKAQKERQKSEIGFVSEAADPAPQPASQPPSEEPQEPPAPAPAQPETVIWFDRTSVKEDLALAASENSTLAA